MIIVKLSGGLGNQLFQYSIGRHLSILKKTSLKFDISSFKNADRSFALNNFINNYEIAGKLDLVKIFIRDFRNSYKYINYLSHINESYYKLPFYKEQLLSYDDNFSKCLENVYLMGYWQSEMYFKSIEDIIRKEIVLRPKIDYENEHILRMIEDTNSVCIHIRNGDYFYDSNIRKNIGVCPPDYYYEAINEICNVVKNPYFFVFSDNTGWAKQNVRIENPHVYVTNNLNKSHFDMYLMSKCKHFITANSSFSWWGAWLSTSKNKIVYSPTPWCKNTVYNPVDILPKEWNRISVNLL